MNDERKGLLSVSGLEAAALCPAKRRMEALVPFADHSTPDSRIGDRTHKYAETEGEYTDDMTEQEKDLAADMLNARNRLIKDIAGKQMITEKYREHRMWYKRNGVDLYSGKIDFGLWIHDRLRTAIIVDYKSGRGEVAPATVNLQLRGQAVLAYKNWSSHKVFISVIQPLKKKFMPPVEYNEFELKESESGINKIVDRSNDLTEEPVAGPIQCKFCKAKPFCPAAHKQVSDMSLIEVPMSIPSVVTNLADEHLDRIGLAWETAQMVGKVIEAEIRKRKEANPTSMPNYDLVSTGNKSEYETADQIYPRFKDIIPQADFLSCLNIVKGRLEAAVKETQGLTTQGAKDRVNGLLEGLVKLTPKSKALKRRLYALEHK